MKIPNKQSKRTYDLADRLLAFNVMIGSLCDILEDSTESKNIKMQLIRSSSSAVLNYGEVLVSESRADFIHKISICLKELMETKMALSIIAGRNLCQDKVIVNKCLYFSSSPVARMKAQ